MPTDPKDREMVEWQFAPSGTVYTLMHASWRKGVEQHKNRYWFTVYADASEGDGAAEAMAQSIATRLTTPTTGASAPGEDKLDADFYEFYQDVQQPDPTPSPQDERVARLERENVELRAYKALSERKRWTWGYSDGVPGTPEYEPAPRICKWCDRIASRCACLAALSSAQEGEVTHG
jgi:hypothetical protein